MFIFVEGESDGYYRKKNVFGNNFSLRMVKIFITDFTNKMTSRTVYLNLRNQIRGRGKIEKGN